VLHCFHTCTFFFQSVMEAENKGNHSFNLEWKPQTKEEVKDTWTAGCKPQTGRGRHTGRHTDRHTDRHIDDKATWTAGCIPQTGRGRHTGRHTDERARATRYRCSTIRGWQARTLVLMPFFGCLYTFAIKHKLHAC